MEEIKKIIKRAIITSVCILVYGVASGVHEIYIGMFTGAIISVIGFYLLCKDIQNTIILQDGSRKRAMLSYLKRYALYGIYLGIMGEYFGLSMIICSALGLLNIRINIQVMALSDKILKFRDKTLK